MTAALSIACVSGKGGVGKTTTCTALAGAFAETGRRVLAVDCDPQSNLTSGLGFNPYQLSRTIANLLIESETPPEAVTLATAWEGLSLIPASPDLSAVEGEMPVSVGRELQLRDSLARGAGIGGYDVVLFDTPPNFGFHTVCALGAARSILVPLQMSGYAMKGLKELLRAYHAARQNLNPELRILGLLPTFVNLRTRFSRQMLEGLREIPNLHVFDTVIKVTVKLQETAMAGIPITVYARGSEVAEAYRGLAQEILALDGAADGV
ncbi:MAG TPA: ParA family protein [Candidatus Binatia bacterium]|nr:ParA family protein [Candidatus Binatia bacterium]